MIVLDNIIFSLQKAGGVSAVWSNLISRLVEQNVNMTCLEFDDARHNVFRKDIDIPSNIIETLGKKATKLHEFLSPSVRSPEPFIFHSSYFRTCSDKNAINVTTVHDFIYEQTRMNLKQKLRVKMDYSAIRKSDVIVCVSENTKKDLFKFVPDVDPENVFVIHNGVSDYFTVLPAPEFPDLKDYVLYVGGRQAYKNFGFAVDTISNTNLKLLICGSPLSREESDMLEKKLSGRYRHILFPSNRDLNGIYNSVYALFYPSSYEGFGIPVLEAQRTKCPVVSLNASSIPEIIGETPLLLSSLSEDEACEKLALLEDPKLREKVTETGLINSYKYSWNKMADEYLILYNSLLCR